MIYCVVPEPLADELLPKLEAYYGTDPNVTVMLDRRRAERRRTGAPGEGRQRELRDRRRARVPGEFPAL